MALVGCWLGRSDLYQGANGAIRQPFPDIPMCLSMVWYMTDVDENSGGTYCVPGAHRDTRNPRGPTDGITVTAPIPGDMQITAPAGSVFIQDSRCVLARLSLHCRRYARRNFEVRMKLVTVMLVWFWLLALLQNVAQHSLPQRFRQVARRWSESLGAVVVQ